MSRFKFGAMVWHTREGVGVVTRVRTHEGHTLYDMVFENRTITCCHDEELQPYIPPAPAGTVPVRIAVVVGTDGNWYSPSQFDDTTDEVASGKCGPKHGDRLSWITAHVPLPQPPAEVAGVVEGGGE